MSREQTHEEYIENFSKIRPFCIEYPNGQKRTVTGPELTRHTNVTIKNCIEMYSKIPTCLMHYGALRADAIDAVSRAKERFEKWEAKVKIAASAPPTDTNVPHKAPSAHILDAKVKNHPDYLEQKTKIFEAQRAESACNALIDGLKAARDTAGKFTEIRILQGTATKEGDA